MSQILNGNGNGHGAQSLLRQIEKKVARAKAAASPHAIKESGVTFQTAEGVELRGALSRVTRHTVVFELYNPDATLRISEVLAEFEIIFHERTVYSGRATVRNMVNDGTKIICEATLKEEDWTGLDLTMVLQDKDGIGKEFKKFLNEWQKSYKVLPEFKAAVADLQMFLHDLRSWLDKIEIEIQSQPRETRQSVENTIIGGLENHILSAIGNLLGKFESVALQVGPDARPMHIAYMQNQIHPFVLLAPFIHRSFFKPLGYAGDYEMVSMMVRNPHEGGSLFAKILNYIFLSTPPVEAHRNRITYLTQMLRDETVRARTARKNHPVRFFNLGCGPAKEIQDFLAHHPVSNHTEFLLLDFNEETLASTAQTLEAVKNQNQRTTGIELKKKSVQQILKESHKLESSFGKFDVVYCAGLFDYLADPVCAKLIELFYELIAPGGLVLVSNVHSINPSRGWMEYILDWHLIYRDADQLGALVPPRARPESDVRAVGDGVNIVVEIRKPN